MTAEETRGGSARNAAGTVEVRVLDGVEVLVDGAPVPILRRKQRALLLALALRAGAVVPSSSLVDALWPGELPGNPRASLNSYITHLRRLAPGGLRIVQQRPGYLLDLPRHDVDALRGADLLDQARTTADPAERLRLLDRALSGYGTAALGEFGADPAFTADAARLERLRLDLVEARAEALLTLDRPGDAVEAVAPSVAADPAGDRFVGVLMTALYRSGRQRDALAAYRHHEDALREQAGLVPSPALRALEVQILRHDESLVPPAPVDADPTTQPIVGRDREMARLLVAFAEPGRSLPVTIVSGESGIGKTRLVEELAGRLRARGLTTVTGRCAEVPLVPLQPLRDAFPDLATAIDDEPGSVAASPDVDRYRLVQAWEAALAALGRTTMLVVDDYQWADEPTRVLVEHLAATPALPRLALTVVIRTGEPASAERLTTMAATAARARRTVTIDLSGLDPEAVARLLGAPVDDALLRLHQRTGGNPFYVEQLGYHVAERGLGIDADAGLPDTIRATVGARLARFDDDTRQILASAALAGATWDVDVVADASGLRLDEVLDRLPALVDAHLVRESRAVHGRYAFVHDIVREVVRDQLGTTRTAIRHGELAAAIARRRSGDPRWVIPRARHLISSWQPDPDELAHAATGAADQASAQVAHGDAIALLEEALAVIEHRPGADHARAQVLGRLAELYWTVASARSAQAAARGAFAAARAAGAREALLRAATVIIHTSGFDSDTDLADEALELADGDDAVLTARLLTAVAGRIGFTDPDRSYRLLLDAEALAEEAEDDVTLVHAVQTRFELHPCRDDLATRRRLVDRILHRAPADPETRLGFTSSEVTVALETGDRAAVADALARHGVLAEDLGMDRYRASHLQSSACVALLEGRFAEAEDLARSAVELQPLSTEFIEGYGVQLVALRLEQGRAAELADFVAELGVAHGRPAWRTAAARVAVDAGRPEVAVDILDGLLADGLDAAPRDATWLMAMAVLADLAVLLDRPDHAPRLVEALGPFTDRTVVLGIATLCWGSVNRFLAPLHTLLGDDHTAEALHLRSLEVHRALGARPYQARDHLALARLRQRSGDHAAAADQAHRAVSLARRLGMAGVASAASTIGG